jgi:hypothetical protein
MQKANEYLGFSREGNLQDLERIQEGRSSSKLRSSPDQG